MTVEDIIKAVRWCIDEEALNAANIADVSDYGEGVGDIGLMDNIIKDKIGDALRWVCLYAPSELLSTTETSASGSIDLVEEETGMSVDTNTNLLSPTKPLLKVVRVRGNQWHRAILGDTLIKEDSDKYLRLMDTNGAEATNDRPQAVLINTRQKKVEVWPAADNTFTLTYAKALSESELTSLSTITTVVNVPVLVKTSFIYYLAYLVLTAYGDARRDNMLEIAMHNIGKSQKQ